MATPNEKLAQSLEELKKLQNDQGFVAIQSSELSRTHLERLIDAGFLLQVMKGWYISKKPDTPIGSTTNWYTTYWYFISVYLNYRFRTEWCLSPEQSIQIHSGNRVIPKQLLIRSPKAGNNRIDLIHGTSLLDVQLALPPVDQRVKVDGLNLYSLSSALVNIGADTYKRSSLDVRTCLFSIKDASDILAILLDEGKSVVAGRIVGAFRNIGNNKIAEEIIQTMKSAGYDVRETDPFYETTEYKDNTQKESPYANRIQLMWNQMRRVIIDELPDLTGTGKALDDYLKSVDEKFVTDAYHSLSIEGYIVTEDLINKVRSGNWSPGSDEEDSKTKNALAARGYWQCFQKVKEAISLVFNNENPGQVADSKHGEWYRELFAPGVTAGIIKPSDLAGYRNTQVYIAGSMHTPPGKEAVRDAMPVLFELLSREENAIVRAILGHFFFVYIHPYMDGNGRIARFLMNLMLASGDYPWLVITVDRKDEYMTALEAASVDQDILPFTRFIISKMEENCKP